MPETDFKRGKTLEPKEGIVVRNIVTPDDSGGAPAPVRIRERREFLLHELRLVYEQSEELNKHFESCGFSFNGIRYRIYRDDEARKRFKKTADLIDQIKMDPTNTELAEALLADLERAGP